MTKIARTLLLLVSTVFVAPAAEAANITQTYDFSFSGFPAGAPIDPWTGSFTITYDPTVLAEGNLDAFSSNLDSSYGPFFYTNTGSLAIGDHCVPLPYGCSANVFGHTALIYFDLDIPNGGTGGVYSSGTGLFDSFLYESTSGAVTLVQPSLSIPEPITLWLFGAGVVGAGIVRRRKSACGRL